MTMNPVPAKLCWKVSCLDVCCVTFAPTRSAAKWNAVAAAREAGYCLDYWPSDLAAWRLPEHDRHPLAAEPGRKVFNTEFNEFS